MTRDPRPIDPPVAGDVMGGLRLLWDNGGQFPWDLDLLEQLIGVPREQLIIHQRLGHVFVVDGIVVSTKR